MRYLVLSAIGLVFRLFNYAIWAYVILSWFANTNQNLYRFYRKLAEFFEPLLYPIRKLLMPLTYKIHVDFSPYVLAILASCVYRFIYRILYFVLR